MDTLCMRVVKKSREIANRRRQASNESKKEVDAVSGKANEQIFGKDFGIVLLYVQRYYKKVFFKYSVEEDRVILFYLGYHVGSNPMMTSVFFFFLIMRS